jgi:hypothetical protein
MMRIELIDPPGEVVDLARPDALRMIRRGRAVLVKDRESTLGTVVVLPPEPEEESDADSD